MAISLATLQIELIEHIVSFLGIQDIAFLRLTCRIIKDKASQGRFRAAFKRKTILLSPDSRSLQKLTQVTANGHLGNLLSECTLLGVLASAHGEGLVNTPGDLQVKPEKSAWSVIPSRAPLVTRAFRHLKLYSPYGGLDSLTLKVGNNERDAKDDDNDNEKAGPAYEHDWSFVWDAALQIFDITMAALEESQLPVKSLDLFGGIRGCSLASTAFVAFSNHLLSNPSTPGSPLGTTEMPSTRFLQTLKLSLSGPHEPSAIRGQLVPPDPEDIPGVQRHYSMQALRCLAQLLHAMPELKVLRLHWYDLAQNASRPPSSELSRDHEEDESTNTAIEPLAEGLRECELRGIYVTEADLLWFLETVRPKSLVLFDSHLISGTYASIFAYITGSDSPVQSYWLDDLRQGPRLVHYDVPGIPRFPYKGGAVGPSELKREGDDTRRTIPYRVPPGRTLGSGERMRWRAEKAREYGPPKLLLEL